MEKKHVNIRIDKLYQVYKFTLRYKSKVEMENLEIDFKKKTKPFNIKIFIINIGILLLVLLILTFYVMCYQLFFN